MPRYKGFILAIDIGGTNTNVGVFGVVNRKRFNHIYSYFYETHTIRNIEGFINKRLDELKEQHGMRIKRCCLSAAGPTKNGVCRLTNAKLLIDIKRVVQKTPLDDFQVINDFQAIGYGIEPMELFDRRAFSLIKRGNMLKNSIKAVIGAGTGLGKSFLVYDGRRYVSMPSEGGHEGFAPLDEDEFRLMQFIRKKYDLEHVTFEHIVSGSGLANIYEFLTGNRKSGREIGALYLKEDKAKRAFDMFVRFYARAAKNYALDILPYSGLYLAGGIISKNTHIFNRDIFKQEFLSHPNRNHQNILKAIPVYAVKNYDINLYGDAYYLMNFS
jgi:glucokinase